VGWHYPHHCTVAGQMRWQREFDVLLFVSMVVIHCFSSIESVITYLAKLKIYWCALYYRMYGSW